MLLQNYSQPVVPCSSHQLYTRPSFSFGWEFWMHYCRTLSQYAFQLRFFIVHTCIHEACSVSLDVRDSCTAQHSNYSIFSHSKSFFYRNAVEFMSCIYKQPCTSIYRRSTIFSLFQISPDYFDYVIRQIHGTWPKYWNIDDSVLEVEFGCSLRPRRVVF